MSTVSRISHDVCCPACPNLECTECECLCDFIADIRESERLALAPFLTQVQP